MDILDVLGFMRENCKTCQHEGQGQPPCPIQKDVLDKRDSDRVREGRCQGFQAKEDGA